MTPYVIYGTTTADSLLVSGPVLTEMRRLGWRTRAVCDPASHLNLLEQYQDLDVSLIRTSRSIAPGQDLRVLREWVSLLRAERPDVVIGGSPKAAVLSMHAALIARVPTRIFHVWGARWDGHSGAQAALLRTMDRMAAACATDVVAVSESLADLMLSNRICRPRPTVTSSGGAMGVDLQEYIPTPRSGPPTLGFVGRLTRDKGVEDLLAVFNRCRAVHPDCRLLVVGPDDVASPLPPWLGEQLRRPGVERLGVVDKVAPIMGQFDVLVFPSRREGFPITVTEAAACGVPSVGYDVTGVVDAISTGVTGIRAPARDVDALAAAAISLLRTPAGAAMGASARQHAESHFSREHVVGRLVDHVESVRR